MGGTRELPCAAGKGGNEKWKKRVAPAAAGVSEAVSAADVTPAAPPPAGGALGAALSQLWKSAGSITTMRPIMPECWVPQYSAQKRWYSPTFVASNQVVL